MLKRILLVVLFITLFQGNYQIANADFSKGWRAIRSGKYAFAQQVLLPLAEKGHPKAQYAIGIMYRNGRGFAKDEAEANQWFLKAQEGLHKLGEDGDKLAQFMLGFLYRMGLGGVTQDGEEAAKWYALAAEAGHRASQYRLGWMYHYGRGITKDREEAAKWYAPAAEAGHRGALFELGYMYHYGRGVPWDEEKAIKLYEKAAVKGHTLAANNIGAIYSKGDGIPNDNVKAAMWYHIAKTLGKNKRGIHKKGRRLAIENLGYKKFAEDMHDDDIQRARRLANEWLEEHR